MPYQSRLYPCTLPTAPVSRSFGLRSSYESVSLTPTKDPGEKEMRTQDSPFCLSALCRHCDQLKIIPSIPVRVPHLRVGTMCTFRCVCTVPGIHCVSPPATTHHFIAIPRSSTQKTTFLANHPPRHFRHHQYLPSSSFHTRSRPSTIHSFVPRLILK
jgi:hypothetical protein